MRLMEQFGWSSTSIVNDNIAAVASMRKLCATPRAVPQNKIVPKVFNHLW